MPRWSNIEDDFPVKTLEDARELRRRVIDAGYSPPVASGLVGWLIEKSFTGESDVAVASQTRYRSILSELNGGGRKSR